MIELPDANLLISLIDDQHEHHAKAEQWFLEACQSAWATWSIIENAAIRIIGNPNYRGASLTFAGVAEALHKLKQDFSLTHHFWQDSVSLADPNRFDLSNICGLNELTDVFLLGLCQSYGGRFVTFDKAIEASLVWLVEAPIDLVRILK